MVVRIERCERMNAWLAFILGGIGTYLMRFSFIGGLGEREMPAPLTRALNYVGPAVFAAIVLPAVFGDAGFSRLWNPNPELIAAVVAGFITWRTKNIPVMLAAGMVTLWLLQWAF